MSDTLTIGSLAAERGQKLRGWLPVPGTSIQLPLTLIHGARPGRTLLVTGGIHGGEYPGIEAAIQLSRALDPATMSGSVIVVSIASPTAFQARLQFGGIVLYRVTSLAVDPGDPLVGIGAEGGDG